MRIADIALLSARYAVRRLGPEDVGSVFALCAGNPQYYRYSPAELSEAQILSDMALLPPRTLPSQKHYVGYYDADALAAVMDLIDGYPDPETAFIGFFMVAKERQGRGVGGAIVAEALEQLRAWRFRAARLCIDVGNPQSNAFWRKNGFAILTRIERKNGSVDLAERDLMGKRGNEA